MRYLTLPFFALLALALLVGGLFLPMIFGVLHLFAQASDYLLHPSEEVFSVFWPMPFHFLKALLKSFTLALQSTLLSLSIALLISGYFFIQSSQLLIAERTNHSFFFMIWQKSIKKIMAFGVSFPHVAFIVGLSFLVTPSGFLFRLLNPFFAWEAPPLFYIFADEGGIFYVIALALREVFFLLFFIEAAKSEQDIRLYRLAQMAGKTNWLAWTVGVLPALMTKITIPVLLVFAYSLVNVEIAMLAGPQLEQLLSVKIFQLLYDSVLPGEQSKIPLAAVLALCLSFALILGIGLLLALKKIATKFFRLWISNYRWGGGGVFLERVISFMAIVASNVVIVNVFLAACLLLAWSFVLRWPFPNFWPESFTLRFWQDALLAFAFFGEWENFDFFLNWLFASPVITSLLFGGVSALLAMLLSIMLLESGVSLRELGKQSGSRWLQKSMTVFSEFFLQLWWVIFPLLFFPEILVLVGVQQFFLQFAFLQTSIGYGIACLWGHFLFVFPFVFLTLRRPYLAFNLWYAIVAKLHGRSWWRYFFLIKLKLLAKPLIFSAVLGVSVSLAQYISTIFFAGGRISTITTEAVGLFQSGNRRVVAVYSLLQWVLPLFVFSIAFYWQKVGKDGKLKQKKVKIT